ncbi:hypothetical protein [uncultured Shewanella sp.]|uniref:hypothetical protein n=1 Tax=uncultured Shewanella sp. TaxID=173975 RepID=UPI00260A0B9D|nr:hypothetical protein [uncultured Shewanella sp.]
MKYLNLLLLLLLTACGGGESDSTTPPPQKQSHPKMNIADVKQTFALQARITPSIEGKLGTISYQLADNAADDVLQISSDKGDLIILNAGTTELIATDTGNEQYLAASTRFKVTIEKAPRPPLVTNDLSLLYQEGARHQASVNGAIGELTYELGVDQSDQVVLIEPAGEFLIWGSGNVSVNVTDNGGRNYQEDTQKFNIHVETAQTEFARFADVIDKPFLLGAKLLPVFDGTPTTSINYALAEGANTDVVQINELNGEMLVIGAGNTEIEVLQDAPNHHEPVTPQRFKVQINKAKNLELQAADITSPFSADIQKSIKVTGAKGQLSFAVSATAKPDVINIIDAEKGIFDFVAVGKTQVTISDSGDKNYLAESLSIDVEVTRISTDTLAGLDIHTRYQDNQSIQAQVIGDHGQLDFALADNSPTDVVTIDASTGVMTVLKPGKVEIIVTDNGGEFWSSQQHSFYVTIDKQTNSDLMLANTQVDYAENGVFIPQVLNNKGSMSYSIDNGGDGVFAQDPDTGIITIAGAGRGWITAIDSGDEFYHSVTERFYVDVSPLYGTLKITSVRVPYSAERTLDIPISGSIGQLEWQLKHGQSDVVSIDEAARTFTIHNAGAATFIVTDLGDAGHVPQKAEFNVLIDKAPENTELTLSTSLISTTFDIGKTLSAPTLSEQGVDSEISYYSASNNSHIVSIDPTSGLLSINGAGLAKVSVIEQSRNFERTTRQFNVNIEKAKHPGLELESNILHSVFYPDRIIKSPTATNQLGKLSFKFESVVAPEFAELASNGEVTVHTYPKEEENDYFGVIITDDGGQNYHAGSASYKLFISKAEAGLGEEAIINFDGMDKQIVSPISIPANEVSYFSAFGGRGELTNHSADEQSSGYSTMIVQVCKAPIDNNDCTLVTLRLQKTSHCGDGSQIGYPITSNSIYTCPGLTQPVSSEVTVSLNPNDPFNAWFTEPGRYQTRDAIVLVHFAKPYRSGGVVEFGDIQSQTWWLINLDLTNN